MGPQYTKRCRIALFGGVCFLRKVEFFNIFMRKLRFQIFEITMELHYNLKNLISGFSQENIEKLNFSQKTYPPICYYSASFSILWTHIDICSGQKLDFKIFRFSPIIKFMFSHYNLKKGGEATFSTGKFQFFGSGLIYGI